MKFLVTKTSGKSDEWRERVPNEVPCSEILLSKSSAESKLRGLTQDAEVADVFHIYELKPVLKRTIQFSDEPQ